MSLLSSPPPGWILFFLVLLYTGCAFGLAYLKSWFQ